MNRIAWSAAAVSVLLTACDVTFPWSSTPEEGGGGGPRGTIRTDRDTVAFSALQGGALPAAELVTVTTGGDTEYFSVGFLEGEPGWLGYTVVSTAGGPAVRLAPSSTALAPGRQTATLVLQALSAEFAVLDDVRVAIRLDIAPRLAAASASLARHFTYGDAGQSQTSEVSVTAPGKTWSVVSDAAWLSVPAGARTGDGTFQVGVDASALGVGQVQGHVTVRNAADAADEAVLTYTVTVSAPTLEVTPAALVLGGEDGRSAPAASLSVSLGGATATHPLAVTVTTAAGGAWLAATSASGTVGSTQVAVTADRTVCGAGSFSGTVRVEATVKDLVLVKDVPVSANLERHGIQASASGVGFSATAGHSVLARTVSVIDSLGLADVPWTATSDQPWLTVTTAGTTGLTLALSANPEGLSPEATHYATVTLASPDPTVDGGDTIRVGLYVTAATPVFNWVEESHTYVVASPVEPVVFLARYGGSSVTVRNVYSGEVVRTLPDVVASMGGLAVSPDGLHLYLYDRTNLRVTEVDATTGGDPRHFPVAQVNGEPPRGALAALRAGGREWLVAPSGSVYDLANGAEYADAGLSGVSRAEGMEVTAAGTRAILDGGLVYALRSSAVGPKPLAATIMFAAAAGIDSCMRADGLVVYGVDGWPYEFLATSAVTHQLLDPLPGIAYPNSIECPWNGLVVGGANAYYDLDDLFVYDGASGVLLDRLWSSHVEVPRRELRERGLAVSADGARVVSITESGYYADEVAFQSLPAPAAPLQGIRAASSPRER